VRPNDCPLTAIQADDILIDEGQFWSALLSQPRPSTTRRAKLPGRLTASYKGDSLSCYLNVALPSPSCTNSCRAQYNFAAMMLAYIFRSLDTYDHDQAWTAVRRGGVLWSGRPFSFSLDGIYRTGLRLGDFQQPIIFRRTLRSISARLSFSDMPGLCNSRARFISQPFDKSYRFSNGTGFGRRCHPRFGPRRAFY